eukprot:8899250-Alexandrium_andersonii.AAC.1
MAMIPCPPMAPPATRPASMAARARRKHDFQRSGGAVSLRCMRSAWRPLDTSLLQGTLAKRACCGPAAPRTPTT